MFWRSSKRCARSRRLLTRQATINARINIFFALDALLDASTNSGAARDAPFLRMARRDLGRIVDLVVPDDRDGVLNALSATQILAAWRTKRLLDASILDAAEQTVLDRRHRPRALGAVSSGTVKLAQFSRNDILRRIEDDRERVRQRPQAD